jgi:hypothetical protein
LLADAMRNGDKSAARRLLSLQFTFTDHDGKIHARKDFLADLKGMSSAATGDPKVATYGKLAAVTGERKSEQGRDAFFLDVWAKQKGSWRALTMQNAVLAEDGVPTAAGTRADDGKATECNNPCQTIPYRVRSQAEQDVLNSFLALEKARIAYDATEWSKHVSDDFVLYRSGYAHRGRLDRGNRKAEAKSQRGNSRRNPGGPPLGLWRCGRDDRDGKRAGSFPAALSRRAHVDQAKRSMADDDQPADRHPDSLSTNAANSAATGRCRAPWRRPRPGRAARRSISGIRSARRH